MFPTIVHNAGLATALAVAATLTLAMATFAFFTVPETMDRTPEEIYEIICPGVADPSDVKVDKSDINDINSVEDNVKSDVNSVEDNIDVDQGGNNNVSVEKVEERGVIAPVNVENGNVQVVNDIKNGSRSHIERQVTETVEDKNVKEVINSDIQISVAMEVGDVNKYCDNINDVSDNKSEEHIDNENKVKSTI